MNLSIRIFDSLASRPPIRWLIQFWFHSDVTVNVACGRIQQISSLSMWGDISSCLGFFIFLQWWMHHTAHICTDGEMPRCMLLHWLFLRRMRNWSESRGRGGTSIRSRPTINDRRVCKKKGEI
jgi:hypothetical protein